jgi:acid phosphatase
MFPNRILCDKISIEEQNTYNIKEVAETRAQVRDIEEKFIRILGFKSKHPWLEDYVELIQCRKCHHFSFPCRNGECITQDDFDKLWYQTQFENRYLYRADGLAQLQLGFFMEDLINRADAALNGSSQFVYEHYTGHDSTLIPFISLIGEDVFIWPPYASHIDIELYEFNPCLDDIQNNKNKGNKDNKSLN